jgi:methanogenic corrinoid protein MtbC1
MASASVNNAPLSGGYSPALRVGGGLLARVARALLGDPPGFWARVPAFVRLGGCAVAVAAGSAAISVGGGDPPVLAVGVLALLASGLLGGWSLGLVARHELQVAIDDRSHELWRALSELEVAQAETVRRLSMAVEFRDEDTGAHIERIGRLSALLAEHIGLESTFCTRLSHAAPLHDVGKVAIPDAILLKPGPLTAEERAIVETHAEEGHRLLNRSSSSILDLAASIALSHHERWDGSGYPRGLEREEIPLEGRIVAVTDVFDALTSDRVYRKAHTIDQAVALMRAERARHFDPVVLDAFLEVIGATGQESSVSQRAGSTALAPGLLEVFTKALEHGDAEAAEGAVAQALGEGVAPAALHVELIAPALRRLDALWAAEDSEVVAPERAAAIARRILATVYRFMISGAEPTRERVLLAGVEGDHHTLGLQMAHDQLAAAGFRTTLVADLSPERLADTIGNQEPQVVVLGATTASVGRVLNRVVAGLRRNYPDLPVVLGGDGRAQLLTDRTAESGRDCVHSCVEVVAGLFGPLRSDL